MFTQGCQLQHTIPANVHSNIVHVASFRSFYHNTVGVQQDGRMHRRTVRRGLNNTGKNNVVYAVLVEAVVAAVCVASQECKDAAMLVKYSQNVAVIPDQTYPVLQARIDRNMT